MKKIGILLYPNVQPMDVIGPWEVLAMWKNILNAAVELLLVAEKPGVVDCDSQIQLTAHVDFAHCPQLDFLIVPGGRGRLVEVNNSKLISFIQQQAISCEKIISVCTGTFLLQQAGLLENQCCTTYWRALPELKKLQSNNIVEERIVKNAKLWLAGGVTSGIDLALALIQEITDTETAGKVQLLLEYFPNHQVYATPTTAATLPPYNHTETKEVADYMQPQLKRK